MLGPRLGRYAEGTDALPLGNPVNACMGLFVLWWGWLAFNSGSTYGVSGAKWQYAARAAVMTMMGSFGGGCFSTMLVLKILFIKEFFFSIVTHCSQKFERKLNKKYFPLIESLRLNFLSDVLHVIKLKLF